MLGSNEMNMNQPVRREFMMSAARQLLGVSFVGSMVAATGQSILAAPAETAKAKSVIFLYMKGAMSHLDTFDPKPGAKSQGQTDVTDTKIPGVQISNRLTRLANLSDKLTIVRSLSMDTGDHNGASYWLHTSFRQLNSIRHPSLGSWAADVQGNNGGRLPASVLVGSPAGHPGSGFLSAKCSPVPIGNAAQGLQNTTSPGYVSESMFNRRLGLAGMFDKDFQRKFPNSQVEAYNEVYREARRMMQSDELSVFDINGETEKVRDDYGRDNFGQGCLLARRLVESGAKFVEVQYNGWDHHADIYDDENIPGKSVILDKAMGALIEDLSARGLLDSTMVVLASEFGRSPMVNENSGRDHHPGAFSAVLCGGGIKQGFVYGESDSIGHSVDSDGVRIEDFNATIAQGLGLPLKKEFIAPNGRPFRICNEGQPVEDLFA
jgi:uncharacterized protein (DUF1501 family)